MPERSHAPFVLMNRVVNPLIKLVLRSPLHGLLSGRLALITVAGRRSGRTFTIPVLYEQAAETVRIEVGWPERKLWWRNLRREGPVRLLLKRVERTGVATAQGDIDAGVVVVVRLDAAR